MIETLGRAGLTLAEALAEESDLDAVVKALARETVIRHMMAETGEPREIVAEQIDALSSMDQEAVLDLTEGEPTTLRDALGRYVDAIQPDDTGETVVDALNAILAHPFPEGDG